MKKTDFTLKINFMFQMDSLSKNNAKHKWSIRTTGKCYQKSTHSCSSKTSGKWCQKMLLALPLWVWQATSTKSSGNCRAILWELYPDHHKTNRPNMQPKNRPWRQHHGPATYRNHKRQNTTTEGHNILQSLWCTIRGTDPLGTTAHKRSETM